MMSELVFLPICTMTDSHKEAPHPPPRLRYNRQFRPCDVQPGDELYPNGIFEFNITRLLAFIRDQPERYPVEWVDLITISDYGSEHIDEATVLQSDLSRPILLAEIAPSRYNVIDGHHRIARARREGLRVIPAHRIKCPEHLPFLTSARAYEAYVEYWNSKLVPERHIGRRAKH